MVLGCAHRPAIPEKGQNWPPLQPLVPWCQSRLWLRKVRASAAFPRQGKSQTRADGQCPQVLRHTLRSHTCLKGVAEQGCSRREGWWSRQGPGGAETVLSGPRYKAAGGTLLAEYGGAGIKGKSSRFRWGRRSRELGGGECHQPFCVSVS